MTNAFDDAIMIDKDELKSYICSSMAKYDQTIVIKITPMDILSKITPIIIRNSLYHDNETTVLKNSYYVEYDENEKPVRYCIYKEGIVERTIKEFKENDRKFFHCGSVVNESK